MAKLLFTAILFCGGIVAAPAASKWHTPARQMERLDRGIVVASNMANATSYQDNGGRASDSYEVEARPAGGSDYEYKNTNKI